MIYLLKELEFLILILKRLSLIIEKKLLMFIVIVSIVIICENFTATSLFLVLNILFLALWLVKMLEKFVHEFDGMDVDFRFKAPSDLPNIKPPTLLKNNAFLSLLKVL